MVCDRAEREVLDSLNLSRVGRDMSGGQSTWANNDEIRGRPRRTRNLDPSRSEGTERRDRAKEIEGDEDQIYVLSLSLHLRLGKCLVESITNPRSHGSRSQTWSALAEST